MERFVGMKTMPVEFECECKATTVVEFREPGMFQTTFQKLECSGCESDWEMKFRHTPKGIMASHRLVAGTRKLAEVLQKKKLAELQKLPQEKPKQIFLS